ncbi:hypothetical protein MSAN_00122600 [Mycena sanguinolenta]|uniref:Uncharacterized protein n=1 Tax=Mycena sanguinolenta TaxID=230812 RepID=A0A8H6ZKA3_9AGAR|nr:hypothetical protein MSAN_00122600 [Mycena sanguinolenta]
MVYMRCFSMMISYRLGKFWIVIEIPLFGLYISMHSVYVSIAPSILHLIGPKNRDFLEVNNYLNSEFQLHKYSEDCTNWIRRSTGRLCTELTQSNGQEWHNSFELVPHHLPRICITASHMEPFDIVDWLTLEQYHHICDWNLRQRRFLELSASTTVNFGAVFHYFNHLLEDSDEIAFLPTTEALLDNWRMHGGGRGGIMPNGWTRFQSGDVFDGIFYRSSSIVPDRQTWLSQANHIFRRLCIISDFEKYVVVDRIEFHLHVLQTTGDPPAGFLFLCPTESFQTGPSSFRWPTCHAYWSLDPSGFDRLSQQEATRLGFPSFELTIAAREYSWDTNIYEGLRQFHEAKGFDPYSQDIARHLGLPLFQLSSERDAPWAYDGNEFDAYVDSDCNSAYREDCESEYPPTSACDDSDLHVDAESSHNQETGYDPAGENGRLEHTEVSNCENHDASESTVEDDRVAEETPVPSPTFRIVLYIQLMLISFLALSGVHHHVW